ncbi:uncharacterized protein LOC143914084 [Arctopsyche grandis]|uniref:uncharacterized protein LOC143914084 n=1 Tax=Arctopsyche grandis TaxID=121162 RepID=UPI00406D7EB4
MGVRFGWWIKVKRNSRAEKAGIKKGDKLKRINDIQTETLTLQEAHDMILESGVYIRLAVTAPEDTDTTFNSWQDEEEFYDEEEEERKREEEKRKKRQIVCKTNSNWSLMWPWVSKKTYIYKESNCFLVPSTYEAKHKNRLTPTPEPTAISLYPTEEIKAKTVE